ncbi:MAG: 3-deoxy-manno-octulosonate cytidylyltransferase [Ignavibacteria bacterium]|nr:3-deoxy-manno-octulosonate cytidylyltransferase [Ignavibacteria bacterium]
MRPENLALIAARMGSERMPGKVLKQLAGIPSLVHIFKILKQSKLTDEFAVITTELEADDEIEKICISHKVKVIRGSVHDVLDRFRIAIKKYNPKRVIRVTGDDPLMDPEIIDKVIAGHLSGNFDYTSNILERTYPRGMDTEVIESTALEKVWRSTADKDDHEHVTLYIRRNPGMFRLNSIKNEKENLSDLRLCLDTEDDYELVKNIYDKLYKGNVLKLDEVISHLNENPELKNLNRNVKQKEVKGIVY